jgi:hypothetical protein
MADDELKIVAPADGDVRVLNIPKHHANGVHMLSTGNDVMLVFLGLQPTIGNDAVMAPVASVTMSRGAMADLVEVAQGILSQVEAEFGKIETPFLKERRESKK